jgi:predicted Zn-dependent protease with MMP-like domain
MLAPPEVPLHRSRAERFDDLILQAVARLEPRWEVQLGGVEFAVEDIPRTDPLGSASGEVPLGRLDAGAPATSDGHPGRPPRIVVYRRPLAARADTEDELGELVFEVVVEEFARLLGIEPEDVDPDYAPGE